jgi:hypothetical protein
LPSALRSNSVRRVARPPAPRSGAVSPSPTVRPGATPACSPLTRLSRRRRAGQRGLCAARRFAPFGAAIGLACEMRSRMIPGEQETIPHEGDRSSRSHPPISDGRSGRARALVDAADDPDLYEPITSPLNGSSSLILQRGATCTPHCGSFRAFLSRGDHV